MEDRVNVTDSTRQLVPVRPFLVNVLEHAEARLVEKQDENSPAACGFTWDEVDPVRLVACAQRHMADGMYRDTPTAAERKRHLADAINYLGMAYDVIDQREGGE